MGKLIKKMFNNQKGKDSQDNRKYTFRRRTKISYSQQMSSQEEVITEDEEEEWKESEHEMSASDQSEMETDSIDLKSDEMKTGQSDSSNNSDSDDSIFRFLNIRPPESEKKINEDSMEKDKIERSLHFDWDAVLDKMEDCYSYKQLADYVSTLELPDVELKEKDTMTDRDDVDPLSLFIFPSDGPKGLEPVKTLGDGNCL